MCLIIFDLRLKVCGGFVIVLSNFMLYTMKTESFTDIVLKKKIIRIVNHQRIKIKIHKKCMETLSVLILTKLKVSCYSELNFCYVTLN